MIIRFLFLAFIFISSCSSGTDPDQKKEVIDTVVVKEKFNTGQVLLITNLTDPSQSYALYLPSTYSSDKKYPALISFDAHGKGSVPVEMYKDIAEQYGYILVGSNNSQNGLAWEQSQQIAEKLLTDVRARFAIDEQRQYLLGFSGGARVANSIAMSNGAIAGVICCGAAAPAKGQAKPREGYFWLGLGGNKDFNYVEMRKYDMVDLAGYRVKHYMITFDGKHEWPAKEIMDEAIWWVELQQMRKDPKHKNDSLIAKRFDPLKIELNELKKNGKNVQLFELCKKTINAYENLTDLTEFYDSWKSLQGNPDVDKALRREESIWKQEEDLKQFYLKAVQDKNIEWWQNDIAGLNQKIKANKQKDETLMYQRTLDYLSLVFYMQSAGMLQQNNIVGAEYYLKLYVLVDPTNSEAHYLIASVNALKDNPKETISSLNKALENGFKDKNRLEKDSSFIKMRTTKEFEEILKKMQ